MAARVSTSVLLLLAVSGILALPGCMERPDAGPGEGVRAAPQALQTDPDLVISAVSAPPSVLPWGSFDAAVTVCNEGGAPINGVDVELRLSEDTEITVADAFAGSGWVPFLDSGQCADLTIPAVVGEPGIAHLGGIADPHAQVVEADEGNNTAAGAPIAVGWGPDLVVSAVSGPPSAPPGGWIDVAVTVCNQGTSPSQGSSAEVWLSTDGEITPADQPLGSAGVGYLDAGECLDVTVPVALYAPEGAYHVGAMVDPQGVVNELIETNNAAAGGWLGLGWAPDLVISAVSGPPSAAPGSGFTVSATVCNQGTAPLSSAEITAHLSDDDEITALDDLLGTTWIGPLDVGQCVDAEIHADGSALDGTYRLGAMASSEGGVELVESNNTAAGHTIGIGWAPDLVVSAVSAPPSVPPGGSFDATVTLCNQGTVAVMGTGVEVRLSTDASITLADPLAGNSWIGYLDAGQCADVVVHAYANASPGGPNGNSVVHVGAIADPYDATDELIESNNAVASGEIGIGWAPDLIVSGVSGPPSTTPGAPFDATAVVCNQGTQSAPGSYLELHVSSDATITLADPYLGGAPVPPLEVGQCTSVVAHAQVYGPDGTYRLGAMVMGPYELNTSNNTAAGALFGVGWEPDLVISSVSGPPSAVPGSSFTVSATACNQGTTPLYSAEITARLSGDEAITLFDQPLGSASISALDPGQCTEVTIPTSSWAPEGVYRLGAIGTFGGAELIKSNNATAGNPIGFGWSPDLIVSAVSAPPSVLPGSSFDVAATVCNQGTSVAYNPGVEVRLSTDATITLADPFAGNAWIGHLDAGQCADITVHAYANVSNAVYQIGVIADPYDSVKEFFEANNTSATASPISVGWSPDLVISSVSGPPSTTPGAPFDATAVVCNQGTQSAPGSYLELHLSTDAAITLSDPYLGGVPVPPLEVGQCASVVAHAQVYGPEGVYRLGAMVMGPYELNTSNNTAAGALFGVGWAPDVVISRVSGPPSAVPGSSFVVSATVCNQGTAPLYSAEITARLSVDETITALDQPLGFASIGPLNPGQCTDVNIPASGWAPKGAYRLGAIASVGGGTELLGNNNATSGNLIGVGWYPDLIVTAVSAPPSALPGNGFDVAVTLCNQGTSPAYSVGVEVHLSTDASITAADPFTGDAWIGHLDAGQCADATVHAYANVNDAVYYVGAIVDPYHYVDELLEANNATTAAGQISVGWGPDLVISSVSGPPSTTQGAPFDATAVVCNQGTQPAPGSYLDLHLSADAAITQSDPYVGGVPVPPLEVGQCASVVAHTQVYGPDGAYRLGAIVMGPYELNTSNNTAVGAPFGLGWAPDLVISSVSGPPSAMPGSGLIVSATVCNQGTSPLYSAEVAARLSTDDAITALDPLIGFATVGHLDPGQCTSVDIHGSAMAPEGAYRLGAIVSSGGGAELIGSNNTALGNWIGLGASPDLVVSAVSAPPSVPPGSSFDVAVTVCNQGTSAAYGVDAEVHLSSDATITLSDPIAGAGWIGYLDAGQCATTLVHAFSQWNNAVVHVGAIADPSNSVHELIEANNVKSSGPMSIGWGPDLVVSSVSGPPSATPGTLLHVTLVVCNQGTQSDSSGNVKLHLSSDAVITEADPFLGGAPVPPLGVGLCTSVVVEATVYGPQGTYRFGAIVKSAYELTTSNNTTAGGTLAITN